MNQSKHFLSGKVLSFAVLSIIALTVAIFTSNSDQHPEIKRDNQILAEIEPQHRASEKAPTLSTLPGIEKKQEGFDFDDQMKLKLKAISEAYEEQAKYPSFSVPIESEELATKYLPDMPIAAELPADMKNPDGPSLSILPSKFRYFSGDELSATARINGLSADETSYVSARLLMQGKSVGVATVTVSQEQAHLYELHFDPLALDAIEWKENITMEVEFQLPNDSYTRSVTVEYLNTIAQVDDTAPAEVQWEYLIIPVYVSTEKPGFHRLQANLYDAVSGKPLVHLSAEDHLTSTSGMLSLKAHISALKVSGSEGPYQFKRLNA